MSKYTSKNLVANILKVGLLGWAATTSNLAVSAGTPTLYYPYNNQTDFPANTPFNFTWSQSGVNPSYRIIISQDPWFSGFSDQGASSYCDSTCYTQKLSEPYLYKTSLSCAGHQYYWRVRANDIYGASGWAQGTFKTAGSTDTCPAPAYLTGSTLSTPVKGYGWTGIMGAYHNYTAYWGFYAKDTYAVDINLNSPSFNSDAGQPVYPVENGTVILNNSNYGFVVVKHTIPLKLDNGTILNTWYSGYMHMANRSKNPGAFVTKNTVIGNISRVGTDNDHLHFAIYKAGSPLTSIDIRYFLPGFKAKITNCCTWYN